MRKLMLIPLLFLTLINCNSSKKINGTPMNNESFFKIDAAEKFLTLGEKMLKDNEPSQEEWNAFFKMESMGIIFDNKLITQIDQQMYQQYFRMAFLPSKSDSLSILQKNGTHTLDHFLEIKDHFISYQAILNKVKNNIDYSLALQLVKEYLPIHFHNNIAPPTIYCVFYNPHNQGLKKGLLIDVEQLRKNIDDEKIQPTYAISHEMHHYFTINNSDFDPIKTIVNLMQSGSSDLMPMWFILNAHYEGFAQQIDIPINDYGNDFLSMVKEVPKSISVLDTMMHSVYTKKEDEYGMAAWAEKLPDSAHPFGYYMYQQIAKNCPKEKMLESVDNPFLFFELYQQYATDKHLKFSNKTMDYIAQLKNDYLKI